MKIKLNLWILFSLSVFLIGCSISSFLYKQEYLEISLEDVVAHPEKYHQKNLRVSGIAYFATHWEDRSMLFIDIESYEKIGSQANIGMWFNPEQTRFNLKDLKKKNGKRFIVEGTLKDTGEKGPETICLRGCQSRAYLYNIVLVEEVSK
ncbi:MAG TPA: hypothetical protein ENJ60_03050 [Aeromonadales bacterium]|nr:hypothetical protein [Aeromonadales bacterium]